MDKQLDLRDQRTRFTEIEGNNEHTTELHQLEKNKTFQFSDCVVRLTRRLDLELTILEFIEISQCDDFADFEAIPELLTLLQHDQCSELRCQILKLLVTIMKKSPKGKKFVVNAGACPIFIKLLECDSERVISSALWALKTMTDNHSTYSLIAIEHSIVSRLIVLFRVHAFQDITFKSKMFSCASNLLGYDSLKSQKLATACLDQVKESLMKPYGNAIFYDACLLLRRLIFTRSVAARKLVELGIVSRLIDIVSTLSDDTHGCLVGTLYAIEAVAIFWSKELTDHRTLSALRRLIVLNDSLKIRADIIVLVIRIFRYVVSGSAEKIAVVLNRCWASLIVRTFRIKDPSVQEELALAIYDLSITCNEYALMLQLQQDTLPALADILMFSQDSNVVDVARYILVRFLVNSSWATTTAEKRKTLWDFLNELNLIEQVESMKHHEDVLISRMANSWINANGPSVVDERHCIETDPKISRIDSNFFDTAKFGSFWL